MGLKAHIYVYVIMKGISLPGYQHNGLGNSCISVKFEDSVFCRSLIWPLYILYINIYNIYI